MNMKALVLMYIYTLRSVLAVSMKSKSSHHIPSFIPPSKLHYDRVKPISQSPLYIRGGQQITSTKLNTHLDTISPFVQYNAILASVNFVGMGISLAFPRMQYHLDLFGTGAFALATLFTIWGDFELMPLRIQISSLAVIIWSVKLASFLFFRACKIKADSRLEGLLSTVGGTITFWVMSFLWGIVSSLPHSLGLASTSSGDELTLWLGTIIYVMGLLMETFADYQKWTWKQQNPGKFCGDGLWSLSQHPNFFGNFALWSGITIMNLPALVDPIDMDNFSRVMRAIIALWSRHKAILALLSPVLLWLFFNGQARGDIGSGVEESLKRYGDDTDFQKYITTTPLLVPDLRRLYGNN